MLDKGLKQSLGDIWAKSPPGPDETAASLVDHTFAVLAQMGDYIRLYEEELRSVKHIDLPRVLLYAALLHDFGKIHPRFQQQLRGYCRFGLRHEVLSLAFLQYLDIPPFERGYLAAAIVLHHKGWRTLTVGEGSTVAYYNRYVPVDAIAPLAELTADLSQDKIGGLKRLLADSANIIKNVTGLTIKPYDYKPTSAIDLRTAIYQSFQDAETIVLQLKKQNRGHRHAAIDWPKAYIGFLLRGLMIAADHLASAAKVDLQTGFSNVEEVLTALNRKLDNLWEHQRLLAKTEGNAILIAPTGTGKTESALLWAALQRDKNKTCGRVFFLLPYRASMQAMAARLGMVFGKDAVAVIHGKSLIYLYEKLLDQEYSPANALATAKQQEALNRLNVAFLRVCSPYQLIKSFFAQKGYETIICSALSAQLVFDEIHAYDPKITAMSLVAAQFLCERFNARVLFMSATLPSHLLQSIQKMFPSIRAPVKPAVDWLKQVKRHRISRLPFASLSPETVQHIKAAAKNKSILVVVNRVDRAIRLANMLRKEISDVVLLHSRFNARDRSRKEKQLAPKPGRVLVATQVVEVSLDIDYDIGFFEPAPLEALLQRMGRVNRHGKQVHPADVYIFSPPEGNVTDDWAKPYDAEHLSQVLQVINDFLGSSHCRIWDESMTQSLLDSSYPETLKRKLADELDRAVYEFDQSFAQQLLPYGLQSADTLKELQAQWDRLFNGVEVLPESLVSEAYSCSNYLEVAQLLVPISIGQLRRLQTLGKVYYDNTLKVSIVQSDYTADLGLTLDAEPD